MEAKIESIDEFFGGSKQLVVPIYQRPYSWEKDQWTRLWKDIIALHNKNKDIDKRFRQDYFIGSVVYKKDKVDGVNIYEIIDGQQRLATLYILNIALRDYLKELSPNDTRVNVETIMDIFLVNNSRNNPRERKKYYKLLLGVADEEALKNIVDSSISQRDEESLIWACYKFFRDRIVKKDISPKAIEECIYNLKVVSIALDQQKDKPQEIFESINSTGRALRGADLIRNLVLMGWNETEQNYIYNDYWIKIEDCLQNKDEELENFFRYYLIMKNETLIEENKVYEKFSEHYKRSVKTINDAKDLCGDILKYSRYYESYKSRKNSNKHLQKIYDELGRIDRDVICPLLLKFLGDRDGKLIKTDEDLSEIIRLCISYIVRLSTCKISTNNIRDTFVSMMKKTNQTDYLNSIKAFFVLLTGNKEFPKDSDFKASLCTRDSYSFKIIRYILESLEFSMRGTKGIKISFDEMTIEHIIPQDMSKWKKDLKTDLKKIREKYLDTIGNLTLVTKSANAQLSNQPFLQKLKTLGIASSGLRINDYICKQKKWNIKQIEARAKLLAEEACKAWPYPQISGEDLEKYNEPPSKDEEMAIDDLSLTPKAKRILENVDMEMMLIDDNVDRKIKIGDEKADITISYFDKKTDHVFAEVFPLASMVNIFATINIEDINDISDMEKICGKAEKNIYGESQTKIILKSSVKVSGAVNICKEAFEKPSSVLYIR
ncbi:MAG: DUF262 domain-containing HNH endonuclease family protein [Elusimicrobiota bacterium]|jgi:uncharacterized protein with ParB-like and HNH nuclease domain|nr:DUF262 domain-containing HNH endonuclease family protein [Elusimicrobiota bacterium]